MKRILNSCSRIIAVCCMLLVASAAQAQVKPLPSWVGGHKTASAAHFDTTAITTAQGQFINGYVWNVSSDTLYVARDNDTTHFLRIAPNFVQPIYSIFQKLRVKGRSAGDYLYGFQ